MCQFTLIAIASLNGDVSAAGFSGCLIPSVVAGDDCRPFRSEKFISVAFQKFKRNMIAVQFSSSVLERNEALRLVSQTRFKLSKYIFRSI